MALRALALAVVLAGCGTSSGAAVSAATPFSSGDLGKVAASPARRATPPATAARVTKVLTVVEENRRSSGAALAMPYLAALGRTYGEAGDYRSLTHPSLPNYLAMAGGSTFGVTDDKGPARHPLHGPSVFDVALAAGASARVYAEAMPAPCTTRTTGRYAVKHNPWAYFADAASRRNCARYDVPAGSPSSGLLHADIAAGRLPEVGLLVPDICDDGHDCSLGRADAWLHRWLPQVFAGPDWRAGRLAVVVTFDEVEGHGGGHVLTVVMAPGLTGARPRSALDHRSWSRWMSELTGTAPLREAASAPSLGRAFGLD
ncbi:alkaline phosphatase family protein [Motilibacter peucedani]|nr:alkaline phosphatase family protein [Motilibacter peucedani]